MIKRTNLTYILALLELAKVRITIPVTLTAITGFLLFKEKFNIDVLAPALGVFFLACGSAVLNHFQEQKYDALMKRTQHRPLPTGSVKPLHALFMSVILSIAGALVLLFGANLQATLLGVFTLIWYNFVYTKLKKITAFAIIPGSLVGALPPMIGWVAANGNILDPRILILSIFFFIGQIPHFWIVLLKYGKEYEDAGLPSISKLLNSKQLQNLTFIWIFAVAVTSLMLPLYSVINSVYLSFTLIIIATILSINFITLLKNKKKINHGINFIRINMFYLIIMIVVCIDILSNIP
ncbi:protoheme IX farnesyltransferase [candidate division KSB1 bacterium]